ncbi:MAG: right-handed parallel beta-helix repeat-containing protein [Deltaproteobacteria bacterium]|nr:right-handed parallel beta-helix repeat-containing protein [Deltaproteobacteria bacterium]
MHTKNNMLIFVIIGFLCFFLLTETGNARVITVGHTLGADYWNIQNAIDESDEGDLIQVWYGTYNEHIVINKSLTLESRDGTNNTFIDGMGSEIVVDISSDNVTISNFTVQNGEIGIKLTGNNIIIMDNTIRNIVGASSGGYSYGIYLHSATSNELVSNTILSVTGGAGRNINVNGYAGAGGNSYGIYLNSGTNNQISNSIISGITAGKGGTNRKDLYGYGGYGGYGGNSYGIYLNLGMNNQISNNIISTVNGGNGGAGTGTGTCIFYCCGYGGPGGYGYGIFIESSDDNILFNNTVSGGYKGTGGYGTCPKDYASPGKGYGIAVISDTNRNIFYHNNFESSDTHDGYDSGGNNAWDAGPGIGGNYWSDYQGTDDDGDGIGDTPYELAGGIGAKDFFPLIGPLSCEGDFDGDQDMDGSDLAIFAADFGRTDCSGDCEGDFDEDGNVDKSDLAVFAADFGRTDCPFHE